jgi:DNA-binding transcriptional MerR regulator
MRWSTAEVAKLAGVSSRTLRHYDHVGLLTPAEHGHGGLRFYDRTRLLRLQHILLLRELGLGLPDIADVLDGTTDEVDALHRHRERLLSDADRLRRLADTVARTIEEREGGPPMATEDMFDGFAQDPYAEEARERWGDTAVEAQRRAAGWSPQEQSEVTQQGEAIHARLADAKRAGTPVDAAEVQEAVAAHHAWVSRFWTPDREAYVALGRMYVDDERFTATIDAHEPGLAAYLRDAMAVYAETPLR